jgi:hypothetical protein
VSSSRSGHCGECNCSRCYQATVDIAEIESVGRYRGMRAIAAVIADADRRAGTMARLELSLHLARGQWLRGRETFA